MSIITYNGQSYLLNENETVLDCLLRNNVDYPHSCKSGTCQSCLSCSDLSQLDSSWQSGLKPTLKSQGCFLPCLAKPSVDLNVSLPNQNDVSVSAKILKIFKLNHNVLCVRLLVDDFTIWTPGKYLNLINGNGVIRSYSIANIPSRDGYIELHVKIVPKGLMGIWLSSEIITNAHVHIRGPIGECYYCNPDKESYPIVLAGTGTGLAPLHAIALDALTQGHQGEIHLIHGGINSEDLYLHRELLSLSNKHDSFYYQGCTLEKSNMCQQSSIDQVLVKTLGSLKSTHVFICGPEETTKALKVSAFMAGVPSAQILSDSFVF